MQSHTNTQSVRPHARTWRGLPRLLMCLLASACVGLAGFAAPLHAQSGDVEVLGDMPQLLPSSGVYYDVTRGGSGLNVDFDGDGTAFALFYTYDDAGAPTFYALQASFVPSSASTRLATGVMGSLSGNLYISTNGECLGNGCEYQSPDRTVTNLHAEIVWTAHHRATVTAGNQVWHMQTGGYTKPEEDLLVGIWEMVVNVVNPTIPGPPFGPGPIPVTKSGVVKIEKRPQITASMFRSERSALVPPDGSIIYEMTCVQGDMSRQTRQTCGVLFDSIGRKVQHVDGGERRFFYYEPSSGRSGMVTALPEAGGFVVGALYDDVPEDVSDYAVGSYLETFVGAGVVRGRRVSTYRDGAVIIRGEVVMIQLADDTERYQYDSSDPYFYE